MLWRFFFFSLHDQPAADTFHWEMARWILPRFFGDVLWEVFPDSMDEYFESLFLTRSVARRKILILLFFQFDAIPIWMTVNHANLLEIAPKHGGLGSKSRFQSFRTMVRMSDAPVLPSPIRLNCFGNFVPFILGFPLLVALAEPLFLVVSPRGLCVEFKIVDFARFYAFVLNWRWSAIDGVQNDTSFWRNSRWYIVLLQFPKLSSETSAITPLIRILCIISTALIDESSIRKPTSAVCHSTTQVRTTKAANSELLSGYTAQKMNELTACICVWVCDIPFHTVILGQLLESRSKTESLYHILCILLVAQLQRTKLLRRETRQKSGSTIYWATFSEKTTCFCCAFPLSGLCGATCISW